MAKKVKIEFETEDGVKIKIEFPSNDPDKIYTYLKSLRTISSSRIDLNDSLEEKKTIEKVEELIEQEFGTTLFTLSDLYTVYKLKYGEKIPKSTLSTYLNRLYEHGFLDRIGKRGRYKFRMVEKNYL